MSKYRTDAINQVFGYSSNRLHAIFAATQLYHMARNRSLMRKVGSALTTDEALPFGRVRAKYPELSPIPCTSCGYCQPCPQGVDIPGNFWNYNAGVMCDKPEASRGHYDWLEYTYAEQGIYDHDMRAGDPIIPPSGLEARCNSYSDETLLVQVGWWG